MATAKKTTRRKTASPIIHVTDETLAETVRRTQGPILIDFWAPWCGPCVALGPEIERAARDLAGEVTVIKANVDECERSAARYKVAAIPTLVLMKGRKRWRREGFDPDADLAEWVRETLEPGCTPHG
jgi:thioredoxin